MTQQVEIYCICRAALLNDNAPDSDSIGAGSSPLGWGAAIFDFFTFIHRIKQRAILTLN